MAAGGNLKLYDEGIEHSTSVLERGKLCPLLNWIKMTNLSSGTNPLSDRDGLKSNMHSLTVRACMMCVARAALTHRTNEWANHFMASSAHDAPTPTPTPSERRKKKFPASSDAACFGLPLESARLSGTRG